MSDAAPVKAAPKKKVTKPKAPAAHPKYNAMIAQAIGSLKERGGSSRQAILKYILKNFNVGANEAAVNSRVKLALKAGVKANTLKQSKGTGASGSFRLGEKKVEKKAVKKPKAKKAVKPKKAKTPKKAAKKPAAKKATKSPKKAAKKPAEKKAKTPKKPAAKKPAAKKPAAKKPVAKKPAAKKPAAKKTAKK